jgi:hypothetical protein
MRQLDTKRRALLMAALAAVTGGSRPAAPRLGVDVVFLSAELQPVVLSPSDRRYWLVSPAGTLQRQG